MTKPLIGILATVLLGGCASERVVLLPSADGRPSALVVSEAGKEVVLDQPYAATLRRQGGLTPYQSNAAEVEQRFAAALAARPPRPSQYTLYFQAGSNELTAESTAAFAKVKQEIAERPASEVMVIGHTDRVGSLAANDTLSRQRAEALRDLLVAAGVPTAKLEVAGRGEREPLVPTADEVAEAKNRRVEISVR